VVWCILGALYSACIRSAESIVIAPSFAKKVANDEIDVGKEEIILTQKDVSLSREEGYLIRKQGAGGISEDK